MTRPTARQLYVQALATYCSVLTPNPTSVHVGLSELPSAHAKTIFIFVQAENALTDSKCRGSIHAVQREATAQWSQSMRMHHCGAKPGRTAFTGLNSNRQSL